MHDELLRETADLHIGTLTSLAKALGLDSVRFQSCMQGSAVPNVLRDLEMASSLGITGTPTFLIGKKLSGNVRISTVLRGSRGPWDLVVALDAALGRK
jgi:predicted DsbA family dithiol-disulfide isomerase